MRLRIPTSNPLRKGTHLCLHYKASIKPAPVKSCGIKICILPFMRLVKTCLTSRYMKKPLPMQR